MYKLVLAICLLTVAAPFAAAQTGGNGNGNQNGQYSKHRGHAPEMLGTAMAIAGVIGVGGYLAIRRRFSRQN